MFLALVFLLGIFLQVYLLAAFAVMLAVVGGVALWWQRRSLDRVTYVRRPFYRRGYPGEKIHLQLEVANRKFLPISWFRIQDTWATAVGPEDEGILVPSENPERGYLINLFSLRWYERARRSYTLALRKRGVYGLGPARLESGDLFGVFEKTVHQTEIDYLTVFPKPVPYDQLRLPAEDPFGDRRAQRRLYEDPTQPMGIRDYHPEDDFRKIHWPATARTGELQVKVYQPTSARVIIVCLNVSTLTHYWEGVNPQLLEHLVGVAATLVDRGLEDGYRVGLVSNGSLAHSDQPFRVPPGRAPGQKVRLLETLAAVTPFVTASFERFLTAEMPRLPYGATLVIITAFLQPLMVETLLRLKQHGHRITVLCFSRQAPDPIPGVSIYHTPWVN
jgi:uncharacterized protein (DUF58 family)